MCKIYQVTQITISWYFFFLKYPAPIFLHVKYRKALQRKPTQNKVIQFVDPMRTPYTFFETVDKSPFQIVQCANINCFKVTYQFQYFPISHTHLLFCKLKYKEILLTYTIQITKKKKKKLLYSLMK